jgi:type I restriction enzyme S subunit
MAKGKTLGEYIEKWHVKKADWQGEQELEVLGVSNVDGITTTSHVKSNDLSGYLIVEPNTFAYNPYRINVGSVGLTPNNIFGVVSPAYIVFKVPEGKLIPELLLDFLKSRDGLQQINKYARGTVRKALRFDDLCKIEVNFPDYNEQKYILEKKLVVEKKSDELGSEIKTQKQLLTKFKQSILQEAIQGKLTADWRDENPNTEPASELLKRIKGEKDQLIKDKFIKKGKKQASNDLGEIQPKIPSSWVYIDLDDITQFITDGTHQTPTYTESGRMFLSAQNVKPFKFMPENHKYISELAYEECTKGKKPELGDLLVGRVGSKGEAAVIDRKLEFAYYVSLGFIKTFKNLTNPDFLAIVMNSPYGNQYATGNMSSIGASAGNYNLGRMRSFPIPFPPLEEQKAIVENVEALMQKCQALEQEIKTSEANVQMLMQAVLKEAFESKKEEAHA